MSAIVYKISLLLRITKYSNKVEVLDFDNQDNYIFEATSLLIYNLIDGIKTGKEIIGTHAALSEIFLLTAVFFK